MATRFSDKTYRKSWSPRKIDAEEDKKIMMVFAGLGILMLLLALFMWWMKTALHH